MSGNQPWQPLAHSFEKHHPNLLVARLDGGPGRYNLTYVRDDNVGGTTAEVEKKAIGSRN